MHIFRWIAIAAFAVVFAALPVMAQATDDTEFTYQGRLDFQGEPFTGTADFRFALRDASVGGHQLDPANELEEVAVEGGLFMVDLDFGSSVLLSARYLEISFRAPSGSGEFFSFPERTRISASPFSIHTRGLNVNEAGVRVLIDSSSPAGTTLQLNNSGTGGRRCDSRWSVRAALIEPTAQTPGASCFSPDRRHRPAACCSAWMTTERR